MNLRRFIWEKRQAQRGAAISVKRFFNDARRSRFYRPPTMLVRRRDRHWSKNQGATQRFHD